MRDEKRIDRILKIIEKVWKRNPDMRLTQLLINMGIMEDGPIWNLEDDKAEEILKKNINNL